MGADKRLRVGIIGCGVISRNHIEAYLSLDCVELIAVCDVQESAAQATAERFNIPHAVADPAELFSLGIDIVSICTPHPTHEELVLAAASAGSHVVCEKPIATDLAAAERMVEACHHAGVQLTVLFQRRFWPVAQELKKATETDEFGKPILGQCSVLLHRDPEYYSATAWRGTWITDGGGVLMTQAIHYIDLLQWLMGDVAEVFGRINTFRHGNNIEVEDSAVATLTFTSGALATIQASTAAKPALGAQVRITGQNGATASLIEFPEGSEGRMEIWAEDETIRETIAHPAELKPNTDLSTINESLVPYHQAQIRDFVQSLLTGNPPTVTGPDSAKALRILLAVYESARTGEPVHFTSQQPKTVCVPTDITASTTSLSTGITHHG